MILSLGFQDLKDFLCKRFPIQWSFPLALLLVLCAPGVVLKSFLEGSFWLSIPIVYFVLLYNRILDDLLSHQKDLARGLVRPTHRNPQFFGLIATVIAVGLGLLSLLYGRRYGVDSVLSRFNPFAFLSLLLCVTLLRITDRVSRTQTDSSKRDQKGQNCHNEQNFQTRRVFKEIFQPALLVYPLVSLFFGIFHGASVALCVQWIAAGVCLYLAFFASDAMHQDEDERPKRPLGKEFQLLYACALLLLLNQNISSSAALIHFLLIWAIVYFSLNSSTAELTQKTWSWRAFVPFITVRSICFSTN
jgi:hypothetical protein